MKQYKFKIIKKINEDIIGFFARQSYFTFKPSKTSQYLKKSLQKKWNNPYKALYYKHRRKLFKLKFRRRTRKYWWFRRFRRKNRLKWWRRLWIYKSQDKLYLKKKIKKEKIVGLNFVYHLNTVYNTEFIAKDKQKKHLKRNLYLMRKKLKKFYEFKTLKKFMFILYPQKSINTKLGYSYAYLLEARLEVVLYRANFFISILEARQAIIHKHILVNGVIVNKPHYVLKVGQIITWNHFFKFVSKYKILCEMLLNKQILINYPAYLEVNYTIFSIMLIKNPETSEVPFPFLLNLELMKYRSIK